MFLASLRQSIYGAAQIYSIVQKCKSYGKVEFVCTLLMQMYSDVTSVNLVFVSDKIINNSDNFRIKCLSSSNKKCSFMVYFYCLFLHFFI